MARSAHNRPEFLTDAGTPRTWKLLSVEQREPIALGGGHFHPNTASCERCGQSIRWVATLRGSDGVELRTGMDCAESLAGGPSEMELRRAQRAFQDAQYRKAHEAEWKAARAQREAAQRVIAEENAAHFGQVMAELAEVATSEKCSAWERDFASRLLAKLREGTASGDLDMSERTSLRRALRTHRAPVSAHFGQAGTRYKNVEAVLDRCTYMGDFGFGSRWALVFRLASGEVLVWKTGVGTWGDELAGNKDEMDGTRVQITFTVDSHGEFRGTKQTEISRVKVQGIGCGYFYITCDAEVLRAVDPEFDLVQVAWARNIEEVEQKCPQGTRVVGPFRTTGELYDAQREDAAFEAMVDGIRAARAA